jgi:hypothetical protein
MGNDYAMKDRMRRIRERYWERHTALPVQEQAVRKLPNPPLGPPNLLSGFQHRLPVPPAPANFGIAGVVELDVFIAENDDVVLEDD